MSTFKCENYSTRGPVGRNIDFALIPGRAKIMSWWLRKKRNFDRFFVGVLLVVFSQKPVTIIERQNPGSVYGDRIAAEKFGLRDTGHTDEALEITRKPFLIDARVSAI